LYEKVPFFNPFHHFLRVVIVAKNETELEKWSGYVESRLRQLIKVFEQSFYGVHLRPLPGWIDFSYEDEVRDLEAQAGLAEGEDAVSKKMSWPFAGQVFFGLSFPKELYEKGSNVEMRDAVCKFVDIVEGQRPQDGTLLAGSCDMMITHCRRSDLPASIRSKYPELAELNA